MEFTEKESKHDLELIARNRATAIKFADDNCPFRKLEKISELKLTNPEKECYAGLKIYDMECDTVLKIKAHEAHITFTIVGSKKSSKTALSTIVEYEQPQNSFSQKLYKAFNIMMDKVKYWN
jgi:hypothetical protein